MTPPLWGVVIGGVIFIVGYALGYVAGRRSWF